MGGVRLTADGGIPPTAGPTDGDGAPADRKVLIDALSGRAPLKAALPSVEPDVVHRLGTLARFLNA